MKMKKPKTKNKKLAGMYGNPNVVTRGDIITAAKKKRAKRNQARRVALKAGLVKKGDGKDVDHKDGNAMNNKRSNLSVKSASKNRSYPRTKSAGKKYRTS